MKTLFTIIYLLLPVIVTAASNPMTRTPTLSNFDAKDFDISVSRNTTNIIRVVPNLKLWINSNGVYYTTATNFASLETTNIISDKTLTAKGSLRILSTVTTNLVAGTNNIDTLNAGNIKLQSVNASAQLRLNRGNGDSSLLLLNYNGDGTPFTLFNGDQLWDDPTLSIYLPAGNWRPTHPGETLLLYANINGWAAIGPPFGGPTNITSSSGTVFVNSTDTTAQFLANKLVAGSNITLVTNNIGGAETITISVTPSTASCTNYLLVGGTNITVTPSIVGTNYFITLDSAGDTFWQFAGGYLQPKTLTQPLFWTNSVTWGPGTTNSLLRLGRDLYYTNSSTAQVFIHVVDGTNRSVQLGMVGATAQLAGGTSLQLLNQNANGLFLGDSVVQPTADNTISLAGPSSGAQFHDLGLSGTEYVNGFISGANYARLAISHAGTNGVVGFDSQAAGSAGSPRSFAFSHNATTDFTIAAGLASAQANSIGSGVPLGSQGLLANSTTQATSSQQQNSPAVSWRGSGYSTNLANAETASFGAFIVPSAGNLHPSQALTFYHNEGVSGDPGTSGTVFQIDSRGPVTVASITKAQKTAILAPVNGMVVYQTDNTPGMRAYINGAWVILNTSADP